MSRMPTVTNDDDDEYYDWALNEPPKTPEQLEDCRLCSLGIEAVQQAKAGDTSALYARMLDPAVTLTQPEREYIADEYLKPNPRNRPAETKWQILEAYTYLITREQMKPDQAKRELFRIIVGREYMRGNGDDRDMLGKIRDWIDAAAEHPKEFDFNSCKHRPKVFDILTQTRLFILDWHKRRRK